MECNECRRPNSSLVCSNCNQVRYCSSKCQKSNWPEHKSNCLPYSIQEIAGKGFGLVTKRPLSRGDLILRERASFILDKNKISENEVHAQLEKLSQKKQKEFFRLCRKDGAASDFLSIYMCNAIDLVDDMSGVFLNLARINHSCVSNAAWCNVLTTGSAVQNFLELRTLRDIPKGDEITVNYIDSKTHLMSSNERNDILRSEWGFTCTCSDCEENQSTADNQRRLLKLLINKSKESICKKEFSDLYKLQIQKIRTLACLPTTQLQAILNAYQVICALCGILDIPSDEVRRHFTAWKSHCCGLSECIQSLEDLSRSFNNGKIIDQAEFREDNGDVRKEWIKWMYNKL